MRHVVLLTILALMAMSARGARAQCPRPDLPCSIYVYHPDGRVETVSNGAAMAPPVSYPVYVPVAPAFAPATAPVAAPVVAVVSPAPSAPPPAPQPVPAAPPAPPPPPPAIVAMGPPAPDPRIADMERTITEQSHRLDELARRPRTAIASLDWEVGLRGFRIAVADGLTASGVEAEGAIKLPANSVWKLRAEFAPGNAWVKLAPVVTMAAFLGPEFETRDIAVALGVSGRTVVQRGDPIVYLGSGEGRLSYDAGPVTVTFLAGIGKAIHVVKVDPMKELNLPAGFTAPTVPPGQMKKESWATSVGLGVGWEFP